MGKLFEQEVTELFPVGNSKVQNRISDTFHFKTEERNIFLITNFWNGFYKVIKKPNDMALELNIFILK